MGIYEDLLIPGTHKWEGVANGINRMAHHHKITEQIVGGRHLVPLGLLDLAVFLGATGDCTEVNQVMVRAHVPPLYLVQPGGDVVQVVDQVRIVGAPVGRGDERDHMDRVVKQLREPPELRTEALGIAHQPFLHQVRADEEDNW